MVLRTPRILLAFSRCALGVACIERHSSSQLDSSSLSVRGAFCLFVRLLTDRWGVPGPRPLRTALPGTWVCAGQCESLPPPPQAGLPAPPEGARTPGFPLGWATASFFPSEALPHLTHPRGVM